MTNIFKRGINSNVLKTIALIAMVIDHIGFYFMPYLPNVIYIICRYIGRISMPIFVYTLVQGFFHTKNFKKYITRIGMVACITQILITGLMVINKHYVPEYTAANQVFVTGNILFTFTICLLIMKLLHEDILVKKWDYTKNICVKIVVILLIIACIMLVPLDYGAEALVLTILLYFIEKFKIKIMLSKTDASVSVKKLVLNTISENNIQITYVGLIFAALLLVVIYFELKWTVVLAIIPIALYNFEKGKGNKFVKYMYYVIFPIQHVLLYLLAMHLMLT